MLDINGESTFSMNCRQIEYKILTLSLKIISDFKIQGDALLSGTPERLDSPRSTEVPAVSTNEAPALQEMVATSASTGSWFGYLTQHISIQSLTMLLRRFQSQQRSVVCRYTNVQLSVPS